MAGFLEFQHLASKLMVQCDRLGGLIYLRDHKIVRNSEFNYSIIPLKAAY